jgi:hypothetical protein
VQQACDREKYLLPPDAKSALAELIYLLRFISKSRFQKTMLKIPAYLKDSYIKREIDKLTPKLDGHRFWWIDTAQSAKAMFYDSKTRLVWRPPTAPDNIYSPNSSQLQELLNTTGLMQSWTVPSLAEMTELAKNNSPVKDGQNFRILGHDYWMVKNNSEWGRTDLDSIGSYAANTACRIMPCSQDLVANAANSILLTP